MAEFTTKLIHRMLASPDLVDDIRRLSAAHVSSLIARVGAADAGELVALLSDAQFTELMDDALWDETDAFDHRHFETWLEMVAEGGDAALARRLRTLPESTLALAIFGQVFVVDSETLGIGMAGASAHEAEIAERVLDAALYLELADHKIIARRTTGWDAVVDALLALDRVDHALLNRLLDTCARATTDFLDEREGLETLLDAAQTLEEDASAEREHRRSRRGFVSHADARAFLVHVETRRGIADDAPSRHFLTEAYFRELDQAPVAASPLADLRGGALSQLVGAEQVSPRLPPAGAATFRAAMAQLSPAQRDQRLAELVYLANVLVAAGRGHDPLSAGQAVFEACAAGLERCTADPVTTLRTTGADQLFALGWTRDEKENSTGFGGGGRP